MVQIILNVVQMSFTGQEENIPQLADVCFLDDG